MAKASQSVIPDAWTQDHLAPAVPTLVERKSKPTPKAQAVRDDWDEDDDEQDESLNETAAAEGHGGGGVHGDGPGSIATQTQQLQSKPWQSQPQYQRSNPDTIDIWQEANARPPMPELIVAPSSTSQFSPPPPAALQPTLRILKRPSPSPSPSLLSQPGSSSVGSFTASTTSSPGSGTASPGPRGTLAEREAQYQEARSRIFGEKLTGSNLNAALGTGLGLEGVARPVVAVVRDPLGPVSEPDNGRPARGFGDRRRGGGGGRKPSSDGSTRN